MQDKIVKIPFNRKFFLETHRAIWTFSNKKLIKPFLIYTCLGVFCLVAGLFTERQQRFPLITIIGGGYLFNMILSWLGVFEKKAKYFKRINVIASRFEQLGMECTFTFSDTGLEYRDNEKSMKLNWSLLSPPHIFSDIIMVISKDSGAVNFTIGRFEVGDQLYLELQDILREKIKP